MLIIKSVPQADIIPLRHSVLRAGQPVETCYYEEDNMEGCFHLAAFVDGRVVSIASFYPEAHPKLDTAPEFDRDPKLDRDRAWRLRGMATDPESQGKGYGAELLKEGLRICSEKGAQVLWCNARTTAAPFYSKLNFDIKGEEFEIEGIGPHYFMSYTFLIREQYMSQSNLEPTLKAFYHWETAAADNAFLRQPFGNDWKEYSWHEVGQQVRKMAQYLKTTLPPKSKVAILSLNCSHWIMADLAIMMAGHVSVPIYPTAGKETITTILEHSESRLLFVGKLPDWAAKNEAVADDLPKISFYQTHPGLKEWDEVIAETEPMIESPVPSLDELATIVYTSGTTGIPKGVMIDYRALSNGAAAAAQFVDIGQERAFSYLPLAHCAERELTEIISIHTGSVISFTESLDRFQENIVSVRPTIFFGVPRIWLKFQQGIEEKVGKRKLWLLLKLPIIKNIIRRKVLEGLGLDKTKIVLSGAAALPRATMDFFDSLGLEICEAYGLTETMAFSHASKPELRKKGSVGVCMPTAEAKLADSGEILLKSPCLMQGYYKEPIKTSEVIDDEGYFHTGDIGTIDEDGFLFITGRVKDIFKTSKGKYVSPAPIEAKLEPELGVEHLCVVGDGLPSPVAIASIHNKTIKDRAAFTQETEQTIQKLNNQLEKHERLTKLILVGEAWTTDNGLITPTLKIRRQQVEKHYQAIIEKHYKKQEMIIWD